MIKSPRFPPRSSLASRISPWRAYNTMFLATSEIAVAISARSGESNPSRAPNSRPARRAVTISTSERIGTRVSSATQQLQSLFQIQRGVDVGERDAELHHGEGHLGLDPHQHRGRPAEPQRCGDGRQSSGRERVDHVQQRHVEDHAPRTQLAHLHRELSLHLDQLGVGGIALERGDQRVPLLQDRHRHLAPSERIRSASSNPPWRSPAVRRSPRFTPSTTRAWATSAAIPVMIADAPIRRTAATVWSKWLATLESTAGTPVMSITTTFARVARISLSNCRVNCRALAVSNTPMIGSKSIRSLTCRTGVDSSWIACCCWRIRSSL